MAASIRIIGDPVLRKRAVEITSFEDDLRRLADEMFDSMREAEGIGLAAPQIGISERLILVGWLDEEERIQLEVMVNPRILCSSSEQSDMEEGCLSLPGIREIVTRPERVTVAFQDLDGTEHERELEDLEARVFQHEFDHLEGVLFVDRISQVRRSMIQKQLKKLAHDKG